MRFISADLIFPITSPPVKQGTLVVNDGGVIMDVLGYRPSNENLEIYEGALCPGFVNAHCHLELSFLKNKLRQHTGLNGFISELIEKRDGFTDECKENALEQADEEMAANGIVAVGDISNGTLSFRQKKKSKLHYHTFLELYDIDGRKPHEVMKEAQAIQNEFADLSLSLAPHAPYSVSAELMKRIAEENSKSNSVTSIHNQETESEDEMMEHHSGKLFEFFMRMNPDFVNALPAGTHPLQSYLSFFSENQHLLLVHNTYTKRKDLKNTLRHFKNMYWCFCPKANLFIENKLPDYQMFTEDNARCCIGTDSLASNQMLSILEEIKIIEAAAPGIPAGTLLAWATIHGANFLKISGQYGSFEKNKKPGVNLLKNFDLHQNKITVAGSMEKIL